MSDMIIVTGEDCLNYIDKPIGLANIRGEWDDNYWLPDENMGSCDIVGDVYNDPYFYTGRNGQITNTTIHKISHNTNKRICGYVTDNYSDGGKRVVLLGDETLVLNEDNNYEISSTTVGVAGNCHFYQRSLGEIVAKPDYNFYPEFRQDTYIPTLDVNGCCMAIRDEVIAEYYSFDESIDFVPTFHLADFARQYSLNKRPFKYQGNDINPPLGQPAPYMFNLTTDPDNTLTYGENVMVEMGGLLRLSEANNKKNPLYIAAGDLYGYARFVSADFYSLLRSLTFKSLPAVKAYRNTMGFPCPTFNGICIPYNIVLTYNYQSAVNYIRNGTLPNDAFLYPLDFDNIPKYDEPVPTGDEPEDYPDDNNPDDDLRDFDPTPNETPTFTVNQLTNYNWYWLTVPQWAEFINWFWNDIGDFSDFDDIIAKIKGLYNDVASAVIMCRYYPVDISWIGGLGTQSNIKLGMIEKAGSYDTISQANALRSVDIGHVHIGQKYKSFMDMSPYSQLSLYLPWHGFIDLDMNLFNGHDVYVKALYDYLSGTIQYYIFYDNEVLVNTILCKMAMDIPITLQTKNDRDSSIFNNVSSTIGGLVGAGAGILSGNPIGMTLGITQGVGAFNSANASAPMRLMGNVGESGAYIGCQNCFVVVRRPTIQPSDGNAQTSTKGLTTWKRNVGMLCGYGYTLSDLSGQGFTTCHSPRINFTNTAPLQSEVEEIYNYLEKGVIL